MIVLHASWVAGGYCLWGESSPANPPPNTARPMPHDPGSRALREALRVLGMPAERLPRRARILEARLPAFGGRPVASSPLIAEPSRRGKPRLARFSVTALPLRWETARDLLCVRLDGPLLAPGVIRGQDLHWWAELLRFASGLATAHAFLPGLVREGRHWRAAWQVSPQGRDEARLAALTARMPGAARCLLGQAGRQPQAGDPGEIALAFMDWAVDHWVRETGTEHPRPAGRPASAHQAWRKALEGDDARIQWADTAQLDELAGALQAWRRPLDLTRRAKARLCLRLEEPQGDAGPWRVRYLLQPHADPSLLVEAGALWGGRSRAAAALKALAGDLREYLLAALGQAAGLCPGVAASLQQAGAEGFLLDDAEAHAFLCEQAPALEAAGFGLMLPGWWTDGRRRRLALRARVKSPTRRGPGAGLTLESLVTVDWQLALGDTPLSARELRDLAELKSPLVRLRGQWVEVDPQTIRRLVQGGVVRPASKLKALEVLALTLGAEAAVDGVPVATVQAQGWMGDLLRRLRDGSRIAEVVPPRDLHGTLRPYQLRGLSWLAFLRQWGLGACLADDMGLGKTVQTLALIARDRQAGETRPVLLVCPTSVVGNWRKEAERFLPDLPVLVHHGAGRARRRAFCKAAAIHALVIVSYGLLHRDLEALQAVSWAGVVLDEAQNIKNPETRQARAARAIAADYRIALTGTPVENHVGELWALMDFLNPGLLGSRAAFQRRFLAPIQAGHDAPAEALRRLTGPFVLRRLKTDKTIIADLPEKNEMTVYCTLTREQAGLYGAVLRDTEQALMESAGIERKGLILAALSKLKQVCNHPAQFLGDESALEGRSGKLARLTEMLEEALDEGDRALVFTQFAEMGALLKRHLEFRLGREVLFLHGAVGRTQRDRMVERFQEGAADGPPVFVLSLKAGGTGLNLTRANHVFHFDRWWNPAVESQATDRAYRIGQSRRVQVHKLVCAGTLEERIDAMIEAKRALAERVVGSGEGWITEMSNDALRQVLALSSEALGD